MRHNETNMEKGIIGLDISTSCVGICVLDEDGNLLESKPVQLDKEHNLFQRAETVREALEGIKKQFLIKRIVIEEPLKAFAKGKSSAQTLSLLNQFNGMVSMMAHDLFGLTPSYIGTTTARSKLGIKPPKGLKGDQKKSFVLQWVISRFPSFPVTMGKRTKKPSPLNFDVADALVIALASLA